MNLPITRWKKTLRRFGRKVKSSDLIWNRRRTTVPLEDETLFVEVLEPRQMLSVVVDFDNTAAGTPLVAGEVITDQWADDGLYISTDDPINNPAMIFDTANITGGDTDLGTPNIEFGGPGIGSGGALGAPGENAIGLGKVLIISQDNDPADPNDRAEGGTIFFDFSSSVSIEQVGLLDIDSGETVTIRLFGPDRNLISVTPVVGLGDNSVQSVILGRATVASMEIEFESSGAISGLEFGEHDAQIYVVDRIRDDAFLYGIAGDSVGDFSLQSAKWSRGATTSPDGKTLFVLNVNNKVSVFDTETESLVGSWRAKGLIAPQGIATDGDNIWIVDRALDRVMFYENGASNVSGRQTPTSRFRLNWANYSPSGLATDGETIWVVDRGRDRVFVYDMDGSSLGDWRLDSRNRRPTGIAIDPNGQAGIWVLDGQDDEVYFYAQGRDFLSGVQTATSSFALLSRNRYGEGIAIGSPGISDLPNAPLIGSIVDDTGASNTDGVTNDNTLTISGVADPGAAVTLIASGIGQLGTGTVDAAGRWVIDASATIFPDGQYSLTAFASNSNGSSILSMPFDVVIDTVAPVALVVNTIDEDSGLDNADGITNDNTLITSGVTEAFSQVNLSEVSLGALGTIVADELGNWSVDFRNFVLSDGTYFFSATATDIAGNESALSAPLAVTIDTLVPSLPTISGISDDSGVNPSDGVTNNPNQTISGTAEAGSLITLSDDQLGELATATTDSSGNWSVPLSLIETTYSISVTARDLAGNQSATSLPFSVMVDITLPPEPAITGITVDSGITGDGVTNDGTLIFQGTAEPASVIQISETTLGLLGAAIADGAGLWEFDATNTPLVDGTYRFVLTSEDTAGNVNVSLEPYIVTVDSSAPNVPSILRVDDDNGVSNSDGITNDNTLVFTGMATPTAIVRVSETSLGFVGETVSDGAGIWVLDATSIVLADGDYEFTAVAQDVAGNFSALSISLIIEIDTVDPLQPAISAVDSDTGPVPNGGITNDDTLLFSGFAESDSSVTLYEAVLGFVGSTIADASGAWSIDTIGTPLADGIYRFTVNAEDAAGNISIVSSEFMVEIDSIGPSAPSILRVDDDTGFSNNDSVTNDNTLSFMGMATPNEMVSVSELTLGLIGATMSDSSGLWVLDAAGFVLPDGSYQFTAVAEDLAGNISPQSNVLDVVVDTLVPLPPVISSFDNDTGLSSNDGITNDNTIFLRGIAEAQTEISVSDPVHGVLGTTTTDNDGNWELDATSVVLVDGIYNFSAVSTDLAGNVSVSPQFSISIDTLPPSVPSIVRIVDDTGASDSDGVTSDFDFSVIGIAESNAIINVFEAGVGQLGTTTADSTGRWEFDAAGILVLDGNYSITATAVDVAGNVSGPSTALEVQLDSTAPVTPTLDLDPAFDTPPVGDRTTDQTQVTLIGTTEPDVIVRLIETGQSQMSDANGDFSFELVVLAAGANTFTVVASDLAGNESHFVQTINSVANDTEIPLVLVQLLNDTGPDPFDKFTTDPSLVGLVDDASPVTVEFGLYNAVSGIDYFTDIAAQLDLDGNFELDRAFLENLVGGPLPFGQYLYYVDAYDAYGNYGFFDGDFVFIQSDGDDITPPVVTLALLNDTGSSNSDNITSDASLTGMVVDESPVSLSVEWVDVSNGAVLQSDITDLLRADGQYEISQARLEQIVGSSLTPGPYQVIVTARDLYTVGSVGLMFELDVAAPPPVITSIETDSGRSQSDGITNDNTLIIIGTTTPNAEVRLSEATLGDLGSTFADSGGAWQVQLSGSGLADGVYEFSAVSIVASGEVSVPSETFTVTIDTSSPLRAVFDLAPSFDTGIVGDSYTTMEFVTLAGVTAPNAEVRLISSGQSAISDADGLFSISNVRLDLGRHFYQIETTDPAGNSKISQKSIAFDQPLSLTETEFVTEATRLIELDQGRVATISFRVDAELGIAAGLDDAFLVYLVDPANPADTILDSGAPGTALFSLVGDRAEYLPGLVQFDGTTVKIDVTSVSGFTQGLLRFQLIGNDGDATAQVFVNEIGPGLGGNGNPGLVFARPAAIDAGGQLDISGLNSNTGISLDVENIRYDSTANKYTADIRVRNDGPDIGRTIVVTFDNLAADTALLNASGVDGSGNPYINMRDAIPVYGLASGRSSDAVRVEFTAPTVSPFLALPGVMDGGPNTAPNLDPIGTINVTPGDVVRIDLSATDADGEGFYYTLGRTGQLPNMTLTAGGQLVFFPGPDQIGNYTFDVIATDGLLSATQAVTLNVIADPITTTRISGVVMDTNSVPLADIPVELGGVQVLTAADGTFELSFAGALTDDTLLIRGEDFSGPEVYPFIAEKLPLLIGHDAYANVNNVIARPIYLPALDIANGVAIDPLVDVTVTTSSIPGASVFVAAGTLQDQGGGAFTGDLSITQVPVNFTPAALPANLFPDLVVTIQPGEMVFSTPAPLSLPNLAGYTPGTEMTLWSINPNTGLFDNVGIGIVSADGSTIETVSGGINNSSWHFFSPAGPVPFPPEDNPRNQNKICDDCEETDTPDDSYAATNGNDNQSSPPIDSNFSSGAGTTLDDIFGSGGTTLDDILSNGSGTSFDSSFGGGNGPPNNRPTDLSFMDALIGPGTSAGSTNGTRSYSGGSRQGGWGSGGAFLMGGSADFGPYGSYEIGGDSSAWDYLGTRSRNVSPANNPLLMGSGTNASTTQAALHSGAVYKSHDIVPYQSLTVWRGLRLFYDSERADARPIVSTGFDNIQNNLPDPTLISKLTITRGNVRMEVPGFSGTQAGLTGGEHFFTIPPGATSLDFSIQADMRNLPTGVYNYESDTRIAGNRSGSFVGTATTTRDRLVHVNTIDSPFGAGWGLAGLTEIFENPDGSVLLVDGDGGELLFEAPVNAGEPYVSPVDDFSALIRRVDGRYERTYTDKTIEEFNSANQLSTITDRNGNLTQFLYNADGQIEFIVDPANLTTTFRYSNGLVTEIEDPAGRITRLTNLNGDLVNIEDPDASTRQFGYDAAHRLTAEVDKLGATETVSYGFAGRVESIARKDGSIVKYSPVQTQGLYRPEQTSQLSVLVTALDLGQQAFADKVDANGNVTRVQLDRQGQLLDAMDGEGSLPQVGRNNNNLVERIVDARGNVTIVNYDDRGNIVSISDPVSRGGATDPIFNNPVYPVDTFAIQIVSADLNNDGFADIIAENDTSGDSISVLLNDGAGGFFGRRNYAVVNPTSIQIADVNSDGIVDVIVANQNDQVSLLIGVGDGTLEAAVSYATGDNPQFVDAADLDDDGFIDLVTANISGGSVSVLLGDGTGQFNSFADFSVAPLPNYLAIGDVNDDGVLDIVAANNRTSDGLSVLLGVGDGSFAARTIVATDQATGYVVLEDVTGDGILDVITGNSDMLMMRGLGDGSFGAAVETVANGTSGTTRSVVLDVDFDGDLDVVFTETAVDTITVFENDGMGTFESFQSISTPDGPFSTLGVDLNLDGIVDLVTLSANTDTIVPLLGIGDGTFSELDGGLPNRIFVGDGPTSLDVGDFNNDGHADLVVGAQIDNSITVLLGAGDGTLTSLAPIASAGLVLFVRAADLDSDGNLDLVSVHYGSNSIEVRYGDGLGGFASPISIGLPEGPRQIQFGDFDQDTFLDLVVVGNKGAAEPWFSIILNNGDGTFATPVNTISRFEASTVDVGDINSDGILDLVVGVSYVTSNNAARPYLGNGDGTFVDQGRIYFGGGSFAGPPRQLKLVDLDGDGNLDIVGVDEPTNSLRVLKGNGNGSFETVVGYALDDGARTLDVGDIDNDGLLDVIATNINSGRVSVFFGKDDGFLTSHREFTVGAGAYSVKLVDLDEDGSLDFVTTDSADDAVSIILNTTDLANQSAQVFEYDPVFNQLTRAIDEERREVLFEIDPANGNRITMTQVIGDLGGSDDLITRYTYTSAGMIDTITDPLGRVTDFDYDTRGLVVRTTYAVGTIDEAFVEFEYDSVGNRTAEIDELGHRIEFRFDMLNRLTQITEADPDDGGAQTSPTTFLDYDAHGNLEQVTDPLGSVTQFDYDQQYRLIETIDADLNSVTHTYDESGNIVSTTDRLGRETEFRYDDRNRLIETINAEYGRRQFIYDSDNNVNLVVDENGVASRTVFDSRNRVIRTVDALGGLVKFEFDRVDNLTSLTDEMGRRAEMRYDELNRLVEKMLPDPDDAGPESAPVTRYVYDRASNLSVITDALNNTTEMIYDERNRMVQLIQADPDGGGLLANPVTNYRYDAANRLVEVTDPLSRTTFYEYDNLNRNIRTIFPDPDGAGPETEPVLAYTYDAVGNVMSMTDALGNLTEYQFDSLYRLTQITEPDPDAGAPLQSPVSLITYDAEGQTLTFVDHLLRLTRFDYDLLGRVTTSTLPDPDGMGPTLSPVMAYSYDEVGNEVSMTDALGNITRYEYDDLYRRVAVVEADPDATGPLNKPITINEYDAAHQLTSVTDALGRTTSFQYDQLGRVIAVTLPDPDGNGPIESSVTRMSYDLMNNELSQTDALGNVSTYEYDNLYRLVKTTESDPDGAGPLTSPMTTFVYDVASQMVATADPLNRLTQYEYDGLGRVVTETYPDPDQVGPLTAPVMTHVYDLMNNKLSTTDALGNTTEYQYDNLYRLVRITESDPDGSGPEFNPVSTIQFDVASQIIAMTDALGRTVTREYDDLGRVILERSPDPDGPGPLAAPVMTYAYDLMNNQLSMTDALGNVTAYEYDNLYRKTRVIQADPDGAGPNTSPETVFVWDLEDQLTSVTDQLGRTTDYEYDDLGRVIRETYPDPDGAGTLESPEMTYAYDLMSNRIASTDSLGFVTTFQYDNLYRTITVVEQDPDGAGPLTSPVSTFEFDAANQLLSSSDPLNRTSNYVYDDLGRIVVSSQPDPDGAGPLLSPATTYVYDSMNNRLAVTDPNGNVSQFDYDNLYRLIKQTDEDLDGAGPLSRPVTVYSYDLESNLLSVTDPDGNVTSYSYDDLDRRTAETIELGAGNFQNRSFDYDAMNNLVRSTDRNDRVIEHELDALYRTVEERWYDDQSNLVNSVQFEFDNANQLLSGNDSANGSSQLFVYDDLGRIVQTTLDNGGAIVDLVQTFDANSRRVQQTATIDSIEDFNNVYSYDRLNRMASLTQTARAGNPVAEKRVELGYNAADQLSSVIRFRDELGANEVSNTTYGYDGIGRLTDLTHRAGASTITDYGFVFDPASRITQVLNSADGASSFNYDNVNQLSQETHDFQSDQTYEYDENGNRTRAGHVTGAYNRLLSDGIFNFEYDDEGNRTKRTEIVSGEITEYGWDHRNRLTSVVTRSSAAGPIIRSVQQRYDVFNQWISTDVDADGEGVGGVERTSFIYDAGQIVLEFDDGGTLSHRYLWGPGSDQLIADEQLGGQVLWALGDHLNSVRDIVDSSGAVLNHITYDAFGNVTSETDPSIDLLFGFTARPMDQATGLQNNLNRWFDGSVGSWISEDPISFAAGDPNLYRYVGNNSINNLDPNGLETHRWNALVEFSGRFNSQLTENLAGLGSATGDLIWNRARPITAETLAIIGSAASAGLNQAIGNEMQSQYSSALAQRMKSQSRLFNPSSELQDYMNRNGASATRAKLEQALVYAELSNAAYRGKIGDRVGDYLIKRTWTDPATGFRAGLFRNQKTCEYVLAFAGTDSGPDGNQNSTNDWMQNLKQGLGGVTEQYEQAIGLTNRLKSEYGAGNIKLAGHSLGGGLASAASLVTGLDAFVFAPAGVHQNTIARHGANFSREFELIQTTRLWGEGLTNTENITSGWPMPNSRGNLLTIPTKSLMPRPLKSHGASTIIETLRELIGAG